MVILANSVRRKKMEKKTYVAPAVTVYGDVEKITKAGGADWNSPDSNWIDSNGAAHTTYDSVS
jgi:hypothetical protein